MRPERTIRPGDAHDQVADFRPGLRPDVRHQHVVNGKRTVFGINEKCDRWVERAQERCLTDAEGSDDKNASAARLE